MTTTTRGLWLALSVLLAIVTGIVGGGLSWIGGAGIPHAVLTGAAAFGAVLTLTILALSLLASSDTPPPARGRRKN